MIRQKMRSATRPSLSDSDRQVIDSTLERASLGQIPQLEDEALSDLSRTAQDYLRGCWPSIPVEARRRLVTEMVTTAENDVHRTYDRALLVAIDDGEAEIRAAALDGLGERLTADVLAGVVAHAQQDDSPVVRERAASALGPFILAGEMGDIDEDDAADARQVALRLFDDVSQPTRVRRRALEAAGWCARDASIIDRIRDAYTGNDVRMKASALHAMGRQHTVVWLPVLHHAFQSKHAELRYEAAHATGLIGDERSVPELIDLIADRDREVQMAAIAALGAIGGTMAIQSLRNVAADEDHPALADAAESALDEALTMSTPLRPYL